MPASGTARAASHLDTWTLGQLRLRPLIPQQRLDTTFATRWLAPVQDRPAVWWAPFIPEKLHDHSPASEAFTPSMTAAD